MALFPACVGTNDYEKEEDDIHEALLFGMMMMHTHEVVDPVQRSS
jgi:hypothetical protein